ncbi:YdcH family protein [Marivivens donghaensis]|uniref:YdcH family protein n=1 Tax=Marivivens donghaensis TaxID=1699413 RepID=A0ABX0VWA9_9RHOB|nr:YdcH family protein [Marivivens donghaensis]NIY72251.1 YdcH family protein [Marivivens donghaensis]
MSNTPHELHEEFPGQAELISARRLKDAHFAKLTDRYHEINRAIHRAETNIEPLDDMDSIELRKERMRLKDEIAKALGTSEPA